MASNGNGLTNGKNGKNGKKRRRRIIIGSILLLILVGGGYGVYAALSPTHEIDPVEDRIRWNAATWRRWSLRRARFSRCRRWKSKSKASGIVKKLYVDYGDQSEAGASAGRTRQSATGSSRARFAAQTCQAAQAARDSATATLERNKVDAEGPDVPFLKLNMERAEQMFKDGVMSKSLVEDAEKNYQLALNKQVSAQRNSGCFARGNRQSGSASGASEGGPGKRARRSSKFHDRQPDRRAGAFTRRQRGRCRQLHPGARFASHADHDAWETSAKSTCRAKWTKRTSARCS